MQIAVLFIVSFIIIFGIGADFDGGIGGDCPRRKKSS